MGFDVTFHSIDLRELDRFFFDVVRTPSIAVERSALLTSEPSHQSLVLRLYSQFPNWLADEGIGFSESFAFAVGILAGFLHPFWYARGESLSFLATGPVPEMKPFLTPVSSMAVDVFAAKRETDAGLIQANDSGGGLVLPNRLADFRQLLDDLEEQQRREATPLIGGVFSDAGWKALHHAVSYARSRGLALFEATDVVEPITDECYSDIRNLRADFLGNDEAS